MSNHHLDYSYDSAKDVLTVEGVKYAGALLRVMAFPQSDRLFRIVKNDDGVITIQTYVVDLPKFEEWCRNNETI